MTDWQPNVSTWLAAAYGRRRLPNNVTGGGAKSFSLTAFEAMEFIGHSFFHYLPSAAV